MAAMPHVAALMSMLLRLALTSTGVFQGAISFQSVPDSP